MGCCFDVRQHLPVYFQSKFCLSSGCRHCILCACGLPCERVYPCSNRKVFVVPCGCSICCWVPVPYHVSQSALIQRIRSSEFPVCLRQGISDFTLMAASRPPQSLLCKSGCTGSTNLMPQGSVQSFWSGAWSNKLLALCHVKGFRLAAHHVLFSLARGVLESHQTACIFAPNLMRSQVDQLI